MPVVIIYDCPGAHYEGSNVQLLGNIVLGTTINGATCTYMELPVFKPNDYFFEHHQREGE